MSPEHLFCIKFAKQIKHKVDALLTMVDSPESRASDGIVSLNPMFGRNIFSLFPIILETSCGCKVTYQTLREFPNDNVKCPHGNYFVIYESKLL